MHNVRTIAIYFSDPEPMGYPFNKEYFELYQKLIHDITNYAGIQVFIVRGASYQERGIFSKAWFFKGHTLVEYPHEIYADLIFNRDDKNTIPKIYDCNIINHPDFDQLCLDKYKTTLMFPDISPRTDLLHAYADFVEKVEGRQLADTDRVVLKKNFLTEGRGVYVIRVQEITDVLYDDWQDVLLQEFLDAHAGIPGIVDGNHDLRIEVINGHPAHASVRTPKKGNFLANVSQGGTMKTVPIEKLPNDVLEKVQTIQTHVDQYRPLLYSADFMNTDGGFKLVELNSRPGLLAHDEARYEDWNGKIAKMLIDAVNENKV